MRRRHSPIRSHTPNLTPNPKPNHGAADPSPIATTGATGDKYRDDRHRDGDYRYKKKKRDSIFDIFD